MNLEKNKKFKTQAKFIFIFGMSFALIMPFLIYYQKEYKMRKLEKGIYDDYNRVKKSGKSYIDINNVYVND